MVIRTKISVGSTLGLLIKSDSVEAADINENTVPHVPGINAMDDITISTGVDGDKIAAAGERLTQKLVVIAVVGFLVCPFAGEAVVNIHRIHLGHDAACEGIRKEDGTILGHSL